MCCIVFCCGVLSSTLFSVSRYLFFSSIILFFIRNFHSNFVSFELFLKFIEISFHLKYFFFLLFFCHPGLKSMMFFPTSHTIRLFGSVLYEYNPISVTTGMSYIHTILLPFYYFILLIFYGCKNLNFVYFYQLVFFLCIFFYSFICLFICLFDCLFNCLFDCLFICLFI